MAANISNNLAPVAIDLVPEIGRVVGLLRMQTGVLAARVAGSGACSFALCDSAEAAQKIAEAAPTAGPWWACAAKMESRGLVL